MHSHRSTSLRRLTIADLRSVTGLIIGLYVTMHLSNHALGLISVRAGSSTDMGNGAVAFTTRPGVVIWQSKHSRGNRAANPVSATPLLHACIGSNPNFARTDDSLPLARAYRKHAVHAHPHSHRHRLHVRDC